MQPSHQFALLKRLWHRVRRTQPPSFVMSENPSYAAYDIGRGTYGYPRVVDYQNGTQLKVGAFCSIAGGVTIMLGGEHHTGYTSTYDFSVLSLDASVRSSEYARGNVCIGHDVWIGEDALILSGVTIGNGAVIGARSVVRKDVPPYAVVGGVPARVLRYRFEAETVIALQEIAWWDWPLPQILGALPLMQSADIQPFLDAYRQVREKQR